MVCCSTRNGCIGTAGSNLRSSLAWYTIRIFRGQYAAPAGAHMREIILQYYPQVDAKAFADDCILRVERELETHVPEKTGVRDILQYFKQHGVRVAVASSSKRATVLHNLKQADILSYFDAVVSGDQVTHGKPAPDIFLLAAQQIGCEPENCYVFEDGTNGIRRAQLPDARPL